MPVSLMNGLSAAGAGVASFAGTAGLEAQKADLQQQGIRLADQLQTTRESAGRQEAGAIAATAASKQNDYALAQLAVTTESAQKVANISGGYQVQAAEASAAGMTGAAAINATQSGKNVTAEIAAQKEAAATAFQNNAPLFNQQVIAATAQSGMAQDQQAVATKALGLTMNIANEMGKPPAEQDQSKIAQWSSERFGLLTNPDTNAKLATAVDGQIKALQQLVTSDNADVARLTAQASDPATNSDPAALARVKTELEGVNTQRVGHASQLDAALAMSRAYTTVPGRTPPAAPAPTGKTFDPSQRDPSAAGQTAPPAPAPTPARAKAAPQHPTTAPAGAAATVGPDGKLIYPPSLLNSPGAPVPPAQWPSR